MSSYLSVGSSPPSMSRLLSLDFVSFSLPDLLPRLTPGLSLSALAPQRHQGAAPDRLAVVASRRALSSRFSQPLAALPGP
jgi:hypothetical protein